VVASLTVKSRKKVLHKVIFLIAILCTPLKSVATEPLNNVVIISIDALHPDALQQAKIPNLPRLMQSGAYSLDGRSTDPPKTLIAHTAMFTGLTPEENGKLDNDWGPGESTVQKETIFDTARSYGFETGYFYSKEKLDYLVSDAINVHEWSRDGAIDSAETFIKSEGRHFVFLHISGLDQVGPEYGWLSTEYLEELSFIDDYLSSLIALVKERQRYLIVITSDHAGHGMIHGSSHPDDYRLPLIVCSDTNAVTQFKNEPFSIVAFKGMVANMMSGEGR
jgi:predicted AlkP superfamily pyrophosphatase or phosphodiesterase